MIALAPAAAHAGSAALAGLCDEYWQGYLQAHPTNATAFGDRRYDDRLADVTPAGLSAEAHRLEGVLARAHELEAAELTSADQLTLDALVEEVDGQLAEATCHYEDWVVDPLGGPQVDLFNLPDYTTIESVAEGHKYVSRLEAMAPYVDAHIANLRAGLKAGRTASIGAVQKVLDQLDVLAAQPVAKCALLEPTHFQHAGWTVQERKRFAAGVTAAVKDGVKPAFARYQAMLRSEILPAARPQDRAGLVALPGGIECYRKAIRIQTSLDVSPDSLHQLGLDEVAKFRSNLAVLGQKVLGTSNIPEIERRLRSDPAMQFKTAAEIEAKAREALGRAKAALPQWFGILPKGECEVKVMGMHEAPQSTIAYYRNGPMDHSRPAYYMINTYKPGTRPRYEAEALAFHESIPGHHLQIAIAQELTGIPEFRKNQGVTAYVEGWALYTERLADEMGLYSSDLDRIGMLSYDAWRACRLVVDTGLHAKGWSRQQAIDYMKANTCLAENNIENEVDRYLTWPGQALAYKCGQLEILRLREEAKQRLGTRFDIRRFHDAVLKNGAVSLPVLRRQVEAWITEQVPVVQ